MTYPSLRPYQQSFTLQHRRDLATYKRVIAQSPTGSGKTKMFIFLAMKAQEAGKTVLIIIDSIDIYNQLQAEFPCEQINASNRFNLIQKGKRYIAMAQTLRGRQSTLNQFYNLGDNLYIINDEAHVGQATGILEYLSFALLSGFTATPDFRWARHLPKLYKHCTIGPQVQELIDQHFLMPYRHFAREAINKDSLVLSNGDYTEESQLSVFDAANVYQILNDDLISHSFNKCIIFCSSIKHAENCHIELSSRGITSVVIHSKKSDQENDYSMGIFKKGRTHICINVAKITKGFDFPIVDFIILLRKTTSMPLYLQMLGRGSRPADGKKHFTVIDYGDNYSSHGLYTDDRDWSTAWKEKQKKQGVTPVKNCPKCEYICHAQAKECPDCGYIFPVKEKQAEHLETELVEVSKKSDSALMSAIELAQYAKNKNYQGAIKAARAREKSQPGFLGEFAGAMGYRLQWVQEQLILL